MKAFFSYALICLLLVFGAGICSVADLFDGAYECFNSTDGTPVYSACGETVYLSDVPSADALCEAVIPDELLSCDEILYAAGAVRLFTETVGDATITYAYTPTLGRIKLIRGLPVNLVIVETSEKTIVSDGVYQGCF